MGELGRDGVWVVEEWRQQVLNDLKGNGCLRRKGGRMKFVDIDGSNCEV